MSSNSMKSLIHQSLQKRTMSSKLQRYTKPLIPNGYKVTPARYVPPHIIRPPYVGQNPQKYPDIFSDPIYVMNKKEQEGLRSAAKLAGATLKHALDNTKIGMTMDDVDELVHNFIVQHDAYPSAIDYQHFPKSVCTSINDVVCHGVPNDKVLEDGDYLNIDIVCYLNGHHGDNSGMVLLGNVHPDIQRLSQVTRESMFAAIQECRPGQKFNRIGEIIEDYAEAHGYSVNEDFGGHGIAHHMHMAPMIYHHKTRLASKEEMKPGMAFTIEPILMMSHKYQYMMWKDNWTVAAPGVPSCQWEHIILITETDPGYEILTLREGETNPLLESKKENNSTK